MGESLAPHRGSPPPGDAMAAVRVAFPQTPEDFENDPRVSYSKLDDRWILEEDDGSEWEWDANGNRWIPSLDEDLREKQQQAYVGDGTDDDQSVPPNKKRKQEDHENGTSKKTKTAGPAKQKNKPAERRNTAIYVTSIPLDADVDEVHSIFSRCGVIAEEIDSREPRIKLYADDHGNFKGDALIKYFRPESVPLAIQMLDDTDFRLGEPGPSGKMSVKEADMSYKRVKENKDEQVREKGEGELQRGKKGGRSKDQQRVIKKTQKLNSRLADWDDDDPQTLQDTSSRWDKVVVLRYMFTLQELEEDPAASLDIKEDIREECSKLGPVTNTVLFDAEPDGIATVRFGNNEAAKACVRMMHGRHFDGRTVEASIATGQERFRKSGGKKPSGADLLEEGEGGSPAGADNAENDGGNDEGKRLDEFGKWLEREAGEA